jgi:UDP-N-acetylmuramoylalanine--D-glutamate ligase
MPFHGKRVIVMGLGRFGGGVGVTRWLVGQGAEVCVTDMAQPDALAESLAGLEGLTVTFRLGGHDTADLARCDLLVVNPAVHKQKSDFFHEALRRGIPWTSEMNLFLERCPARLIGVTGSVGKSTTTAMIGAVLERARDPSRAVPSPVIREQVFVGGNIGRSLLDELPRMDANDWVVLELSSFQLEDAAAVRRSPNLALITNLRPNHLDRHGTLEAYAKAKLNIVAHQRDGDVVFINSEDEPLRRRVETLRPPAAIRAFGDAETIDALRPLLKTPGRHNLLNAAAAMAVARHLDIPDDICLEALADFTGLPHRLEFAGKADGVRYFNDSKSTTPESAITALAAFEEPLVMLVGGADKGVAFDELTKTLANRARAVVCYGATGARLAAGVGTARGTAPAPAVSCVIDLPQAVALARETARPGDVVVLSPACASYDQFRNYEERGEMFRRLVANL